MASKKKRTGLDALNEYEAQSGRQSQSVSQQAASGSSGGTWRSGLDALREYEANGGGQNVRNGPYNPGYRTGTRPMSQEEYTAAYEKYRKIADVQQAGYRRQQRLLGDTSNRDVDNDIQTSRQREQEGLFKRYQQAMAALEGRERQTRRIMDTSDAFGADENLQAQTLRQGWKSAEQRAREAEAYAASQPNVQQDQLRGMRRTAKEMDRQLDQLTAAQADLYTRGYYFDDDGTAWYYDANGNRVDARTVMDTQARIDALEKRRQPLSGMISDAETAAEFESRKNEIAALAYSQGEWTQEQRNEAKAILESQRGTGGLLGTGMDVYAFGPYMEALRRGDTASASEWESIYNMLYARLYPGQTAIAGGFAQGIGLTSTAQVMGKALGVDENPAWAAYQRAYQRAQAERPVLAAGANIAGSVALMSGISQGIGAASSAALGAKAASMSAGAKTALSMGQSALTFMVKDAIQGAGSVAMGEKSGGAYVQDILASGAGGAAGTLVSGLISTDMANWLRKTGNMTPFWEFVRQSVSAFSSSSTNIATSTLLGSEKKSGQQVATELGTAFLFSLVNGYIGTMRETRTASRAVEQKYEQMEQQLAALGKHFSGKTYSSEAEFEQAVNDLRQTVQGLKAEVQGTYYAGQQGFTDQLVSALDRMDYNLLSMLDTGLSGGADAAAAATAVGGMPTAEAQELLTDAAEALSGGAAQGAGPNPTQPAPDAATARPQAAEMPTGAQTQPTPEQAAQAGAGGAAKAAEDAFTLYNRAADERDRLEQARRNAAAERSTVQYGQQEAGGRNGEGRTEGVYSGGQGRGMGEGSEIERTLERQGEAVRLRNRAKDLGAENISPAEAGLKGGDTTKSLLKVPEAAYGAHEKALQKAVEARGASLNIVMGRIRLANGTAVDEFIDTGTRQITVRADCTKWAMENLIDHALFHDLSTEQRNAAAQAVADRFSESELMAIAGQYVKRMRGVYEGMSEEALFNIATEEVLADAAGRMLRYTDADATKFTETVRGILDRNGSTAAEESGQRFSYAGELARTADKETLERAKQSYSVADTENGRRERTQDEITAEYQNAVHGILNGTINSKDALLVGYTPEIYRKLGMPDLPFVVGSGHVYSIAKTQDEAKAEGRFRKNTNYHGLGERAVADILQAVKNPVMVISAKDVDRNATPLRSTHSVVALVDVGTNGKSLVVPVSITAQNTVDGTVMDVNMISSVYEKNARGLVNEAIAQFNSGENSIFYVTKKAATLAGEGVQFPSILQAAATSSDGIVRKLDSKINMSIENVTQSQQFKRWFGDWQNKPETASKIVNADGTPKVVYHQTENDFTVFDVHRNGAGARDNETPFGIFLKSSNRDIGLNGKKQMALYANIRNPLYAQDRADLTRQLRELSPEYDAIRQEHAALDKEYKQKFEDAKRNFINFLTEWKKNHPGESSRSLYGMPEFERVFDAEDSVVEEWTSKADALSVRAKEVLTDALKQAGYDGVILANDTGSWGRSTDAYIALSENQVKSATDNVGTFDRDNPDIRYSPADTETETSAEEAKRTAAEGTPIFNFDAKYDFAYGADPNPFYRMIGITPPGLRIGIEAQATRAADKIENGQAYAKALLDFATKPDRSTKTLTLNFPNADGTYRSENVQNTKIMQDIYKYYAEAVPEENRHSEADFWMWRRRIAEGSVSSRIETMSAEAKAQAWQESARADFKSTGALEKMGVKVERSIGRYGRTQSLIETDKAYKQAKKEVNRAIDRLAATPKEISFARQIADGVFDMRDIPRGYDKRVVLSLVDYMNAEAALGNDRILAQRKAIRQETTDTVEALFNDSADNKVSGMFTLNHRTAQRNMLHIFGDETGQKLNRAIFDPISRNEAERIRFVNRQFDDVRTFEDSTGKKSELTHEESILVQLVMEGKATVALLGDMPGSPAISKAGMKIADGMKPNAAAKSEHLNKNEKQLAKMYASWVSALRMMADGKIDTVKIDNAAKVYTQKYNEFYAAINDFLVAHGYEPIGFIQNYAPHMQAEETRTALDSALKMLGINEDTVTLPTSIAGLTADFKPNKRWNPYFLHRTGETYNFDVAKGFESYVAYMSELFYHTDDIMTVRALSDYLRRRYSSEDISFDIDKYTWLREKLPDEQLLYLQQRGKLEHGAIVDSEQLDSMIDKELTELYENAKNHSKYSNLVVWLDNYANILAGKQTKGDRSTEEDFGRKTLNLGNRLTRGFGAAKVAGNIASILNQTAQIPTILAEKGLRNTAAAIKDMVTGQLRKADFTLESDYLTSKKGVHFLVTDEKNMYEWALDKVGQAQEFADAMVSTIAVRAAYLEGIQKGMSHKQAMRYADKYGAQVMGDRSKGAKPVAFSSKNPVMQLINTFQLEVANSWEHVTQDTAGFDFREMARKFGKDKAVKALAGIIVKFLLATYIWNRISDETYGGTPAPYDVLGITSNFIAGGYGLSINDAMKTVMDNGWEKVTGERLFDTEDKERSFNAWKAIEAAGGDIANDIPYLQNASAMIGWGDNTLPAAIPTKALDNMINAVKGGKGVKDITKAAFDVGTEIAPGGSQIKKTARGIDAMVRGGVYQGYGDQTKLRYPVDNKNIGKWIQAVVFGPNGLSETGRYYAGEERAIGEKQTTAYQAMIAAGADKEESYRLIRRITKLGDDEDSKLDKLNMLLSSKVSTAGQGAYYYIMMAGDKERERIDALTGENGVIGMDDYLRAAQKKLQIDADEEMRPTEKADAFRQWVNQQGYSAEQKRGVLDAFKFSQIIMVGGGHSELYQAALEGVSEYDSLRADAIAAEKADGKSQAQAESSVNSGLRSQMKQDYLDGLVDDETASAFLKEYTGANDDDVFWTLEEWKGGEDWKKYGQFLDAAEKGVAADTRKVAKYYMSHGVEKGTLSSQLTTYFKERWLAASGDEATRLKNAYISAYKAIGGDADKARENMIKWRQEANKKKGAKK